MIWLHLQHPEQVDALIAVSDRKPVLFFKHSTRCSVSLMAKRTLEHSENILSQNLDCYLIDVLEQRAISNYLASVSGITHQSPQAIVYASGKVVYAASHHHIDADDAVNSLKLN